MGKRQRSRWVSQDLFENVTNIGSSSGMELSGSKSSEPNLNKFCDTIFHDMASVSWWKKSYMICGRLSDVPTCIFRLADKEYPVYIASLKLKQISCL